MNWIYNLFTRLLRIFSHLYFVEVRPSGIDRVPARGPVILAANHPTSVLDAILLATQTPRQIHFLARIGLFRNRMLARLLYWLGVIPVYRTHETKNPAERNETVFKKVYELFDGGGCLGIFPEGRNSPPGRVAELRKGCARIALSAEARNNYQLGLVIVPVGLNYENRELFMSTVLLRFGPPIRVADYADAYQREPEKAVALLTADLQTSLRRQATHIEDRQIAELAEDLLELSGNQPPGPRNGIAEPPQKPRSAPKRWLWKILDWYRPDMHENSMTIEKRVQSRQELREILTHAADSDPDAVSTLRLQLDRYHDHLRQTALRQRLKQSLDEPVKRRLIRLKMTFYTLIMAPVALFGLIHNLLPYLFTKYAARISRDEAVRAFAYFGIGVLAFTGAYTGYGFWLWYYAGMNWKHVLAYLALLPPTGFAALRYRRNILIYRDMILVRTFFWDQDELVQLLRRERQGLIETFEALVARTNGWQGE